MGFDRATLGLSVPDENGMVAAMERIAAGHADRLLLSSHVVNVKSTRDRGGPRLAQTVTVFAPILSEAGSDDATLRTFVVDNLRRFREFGARG